ncbi:hypothetical protein ACA910_020641 [Epithemia clementina (nom. ined.)]
MPKSEQGSVKDIAKRIKAKGLQKLKFYCQMCEKQCRDANGFKCHIQSESHLRQMKLFSENASGIMDKYSREFEKVFLDTLRMLHGTVQVNANQVYQQVIRDKQHIHMNSTIWATLKDFCQYLGKTGKCRVEETERGWYITYINRDVDQIVRQQQAEQRMQAELEAEAELQKRMEERRKEAALALETAGFEKKDATNLQPRSEDEKIQISLVAAVQAENASIPKRQKTENARLTIKNVLDTESDEDDDDDGGGGMTQPLPPPPLPAPPKVTTEGVDSSKRKRPMNDQKNSTRHENDQSSMKQYKNMDSSVWLYRDIVVRVIDKKFKDGKFFRRKAYVDRVLLNDNDHRRVPAAEVTLIMTDNHDKDGKQDPIVLQLPQDSLETVVPKHAEEGRVRVLRGHYRGKKAVVLSLDKKNYQARLKLSDGTILEDVGYEDFAQIA